MTRLLLLALVGVAALGSGACAGVRELRPGVFEARCRGSYADCLAAAKGKCDGLSDEIDREGHLDGASMSYTVTFGCASKASDAANRGIPAPQSERLRSAAVERVEQDYIAADCKRRTIAEITVRQCGLDVLEQVWAKDAVARFFRKVCKLSDEELSEEIPKECTKRLSRKWYASLAERYYLMDPESVRTRCDAHPEQCERLEDFEQWCLESHNKRVLRRYQDERAAFEAVASAERSSARAALERKQAVEEQEARAAAQAFGAALGQLGAHLQGKPVFRCSADGQTCWQE